ncbi:MAG: amidohydrolase family protein [Chloroflexota bacterium]
MLDLILRNACLNDGRVVDIGIESGLIGAIEPHLSQPAHQELSIEARLTIPAFVNGQLHACKSFWRRLLHTLPDEIQNLPRFDAATHVKSLYTSEDVFARVDEVMKLAIQNGTCAIRLFADVDEASGLSAMDGLLAIREKYAPIMTVQVVAFPQDGVLNEATQTLMRQALERGADVVGGIPWIEPDKEAQEAHIEMCFTLAQQFDCDLHFVCDDVADPGSRTLEMVAGHTIQSEWHNRVSATQCAALSFYPDEYANQLIQRLKEAGITIFSNSHVSLIATDFDEQQHPWPRSTTRIRQLLDAGVPVACGQDDIDNWFYPFGRNDMLEVAQFMAHSGRFAWRGEVEQVLSMVTTTAANVLGMEGYGLTEGAAANLVVLDAPDWHSAIQFQPDKRYVILNGKVRAETVRKQTLDLS